MPMLVAYLRKRVVWVGVIGYALVGIVLNAFTTIDILPPCLWCVLFDAPCCGCGLTTAFTHLVRFEFGAACDAHPLSIPIAVFMLGCIVADYMRFVRSEK